MTEFMISLSPDGKTVTLSARGRFDLSLGFALWQYCQPEQGRHQTYIFDLSGVDDLHDSGLGWLKMFMRWAQRSGACVRMVNTRPEIEQRLIAAGIDTQGAVGLEEIQIAAGRKSAIA
ncbi:MAG: STAS domain-containing protein [Acidobacteria bacterium]|nr:STAS domain-containing protein [Acidobacteriota bacterium]